MFHKSNLNKIIANYTGQPLSKIEQDTDRDNYMNPIEAREYGIIDHVIGGDEGVFKVKGSIRKFPKVSEAAPPPSKRPHAHHACMHACIEGMLGRHTFSTHSRTLVELAFAVLSSAAGVCAAQGGVHP